jgi:hypothetical protein
MGEPRGHFERMFATPNASSSRLKSFSHWLRRLHARQRGYHVDFAGDLPGVSIELKPMVIGRQLRPRPNANFNVRKRRTNSI